MKTLKRLLSIALLPWLGIAAFAQAAAPTAAQFAQRSKFLSAKISPNGDYVAVTFWHDDVIALGVIDLKTKKISSSVWFSHDQHVASYAWASDKRLVIGLGKGEGVLDQPAATGELFAMDADGSQKIYLYGYNGDNNGVGARLRSSLDYGFAQVIDTLPSDPDHVLIAVHRAGLGWSRWAAGLTIELLDVRNGARRRVSHIETARGAGSGFGIPVVADDKGQPRYAVVQDDEGRAVEMKRTPDDGWVAVRTHERYTDVWPLGLSADGSKVYLMSNEGSDLLCAHTRDLVTSALETLACGEGVDARLAFVARDGRPIAMLYEAGKPQAALVGEADRPEARAYASLLKAFPGQRVVITSGTRGFRKLIAFVDSDRNPGDYYLFDTESMHAEYLFSYADWVDPEAMAPVLPIDVKARDGRMLHGYVTSRGGLNPEKRPMVLLVHGGPHGVRDGWGWESEPQYLASLGYTVLQVNYRGSGGYGRDFEKAGYREWGGKMQDDLTDAVRWAIGAGIADPARMCIMGASYGGYAAMMSAVREPALYRCAVTMAGPVDLVTQGRDSDISSFGFGRLYLREVLGDDEETLRRNSPITYIDRLQAPVLIVHGRSDERVPFSQARELSRALDRLHKPYKTLPFKGEEHGFYVPENYEKYLLAVKSFLEENIGPGIPGVMPEAEKK